jgi:hypothetical protein
MASARGALRVRTGFAGSGGRTGEGSCPVPKRFTASTVARWAALARAIPSIGPGTTNSQMTTPATTREISLCRRDDPMFPTPGFVERTTHRNTRMAAERAAAFSKNGR